MDIKNQWIETLCSDLCHQIEEQNNVQLTDSLHNLRLLCGGYKCGCSDFNPAQRLSHLVRVELANGRLVDYNVGLSIVDNFPSVSHHSHCLAALENLLGRALKSNVTEKERYFLDKLWLCPGLRGFKIELVSDLVHTESRYVEQDIFSIFEEVGSESVEFNSLIWEDNKFERLVHWSSKSAKVFCTVTSILNSILHQTLLSSDHFEVSEDIISSFISSVRNHCKRNNTDFVTLYPSEYHSLVSLMEVSPSLYVQSSSAALLKVVEIIRKSLVRNQTQTNCLLTHFPEWVEYIDR